MTERNSRVPEIARDVAAALGEGWSSAPGAWGNGQDAYLEGPDGVALHFRYSEEINKTQFQIGLATLRLKPFQWVGSSVKAINVSVDKQPRQIAGSISRRLLPQAIPVFREALEKKRASEEHEAAIARLAEDIRSALGGGAYVQEQDRSVRLGENSDEMRVEVDPRYRCISFTVEVMNRERAIRLAQAIGRV